MRSLLFALTGLLLLVSTGARAECFKVEDNGCLSLELVLVDQNRSNPNPLVEKRIVDKQPFDVSLQIFKGTASKQIELHEACEDFHIYIWGLRTRPDTFVSFDGDHRLVVPTENATLQEMASDRGVAQFKFTTRICGGLGAVMIPDGDITENTYVAFCPQSDTLAPGKHGAIWFTPKEFSYFRSKGWTWTISSLVY